MIDGERVKAKTDVPGSWRRLIKRIRRRSPSRTIFQNLPRDNAAVSLDISRENDVVVVVVGLEIECRYSIYLAARIIRRIGESRDFAVSQLFRVCVCVCCIRDTSAQIEIPLLARLNSSQRHLVSPGRSVFTRRSSGKRPQDAPMIHARSSKLRGFWRISELIYLSAAFARCPEESTERKI